MVSKDYGNFNSGDSTNQKKFKLDLENLENLNKIKLNEILREAFSGIRSLEEIQDVSILTDEELAKIKEWISNNQNKEPKNGIWGRWLPFEPPKFPNFPCFPLLPTIPNDPPSFGPISIGPLPVEPGFPLLPTEPVLPTIPNPPIEYPLGPAEPMPPRSEAPKLPKVTQEDIDRLEEEASEIAGGLKDAIYEWKIGVDNTKTLAFLEKITPENVAYVVRTYENFAKESLAIDIDGELQLDIDTVKQYICVNLLIQAKKLDLGYSSADYDSISDIKELAKWIKRVSDEICNKMQSIADTPVESPEEPATTEPTKPVENKPKTPKVSGKDIETIEKDAKKIAQELKDAIYEKGKIPGDNRKTLALLEKITPENVAYVVREYERLTHSSLAKHIDSEIYLDINTVRQYICKPLVEQAKKFGVKGVYHRNWQEIDDIHKLSQWIETVSNKVRIAMEKTLSKSAGEVKETRQPDGNIEKTITDHPKFKEAGISKIVEIRTSNGEFISSTTYFNDGKVVEEKFVLSGTVNGKKEVLDNLIVSKDKKGFYSVQDKSGKSYPVQYDDDKGYFVEINGYEYTIVKTRKMVQKGSTQKVENNTNIYEPIPITIKLPPDAHENAKKFAKALEQNKATLMRILKIDNDTYNKLARLAMAIAEQETQFGTVSGGRGAKYDGLGMAQDTVAGDLIAWMKGSAISCGMTQIKFDDHVKDPDVKKVFESLGITKGSDLYSAENSAKGTVALLSVLAKRIKNNKRVQDGAEAARGAIVEIPGWSKKDGEVQKTYETEAWVNDVTEEDILAYFWNGRGASVINGTMQPEANVYTRNVRKYMKKYDVVEDPKVRAAALKRAKSLEGRPRINTKSVKPMDCNGAIGSIMFMPKMYNKDFTHSQQDINFLKTTLASNHNISAQSKKLLIQAVERGEIAFEFGMDKSEIASLTQKDVDMLLKRVNTVKMMLKEINFDDGISKAEADLMATKYAAFIRAEEYAFRKEYLESKAPIFSTSELPPENVLMTPNNNPIDAKRMARADRKRRGFVGYHNDKGVNPANTTPASRKLAEVAQKVAHEMRTAGKCMTGFRKAMLEAGVEAANSKDLVEGTPRATVGWFERHPDMFEEVKFINIGGGQSRQLTSTDLPNLPAGYIVIWIPEKEHAQEPGHICITNGNGEAYADETDNLNWGAYADESSKTGKGEHGTFRVFRLTDKWEVGPDGKLKFNG